MNVNTSQMLENLGQILPMLTVVVGALLTMLISVARSHKEAEHSEISAHAFVVVSLVTLALSLFLLAGMTPQKEPIWAGTLSIDRLSLAAQGLIVVISAIALGLGTAAIQTQKLVRGEYYSLTLFAVSGMMLMVSASELLTFFVGLEIMSLAVYVLVGFRRADRWSQEAALKYFLSGAFASAFFLFGSAMLFGATGTTDYAGIARSVAKVIAGETFPLATLLLVGATLCVVGFAFKIAAVPFHMWAPDAYQGAPTMVTGFMAVTVKAAAFVSFLRFVLIGLSGSPGSSLPQLVPLFETLAILTMTVGNLSAVLQRDVKRMLAYSSIAQAGYLLVGMIGAVLKGEVAVQGMVFYLFVYALSTLGAFGVLIALERRGARHEDNLLNRYSGVAWQHPALGLAFAVCMFALSGIPPTAGFVGKVLLFGPALDAGHVTLVVIAVLNSVVSVYYYLRVVVYMFMKSQPTRPEDESLVSSPWLRFSLGVAVILVLVVGITPQRWLETFSKLLS
jgi:NADH-quinone oxidoreductase subunit N